MQSQNHFIQLIALFFLLKKIQLTRFLYSVLIALAISILIGVIGYLFYSFLFLAIQIHFNFPFLIWFIPLIGLITVYLYKTVGKEVAPGNKLLFAAYSKEKNAVSFLITPLIFLTTCLSHLVGISIGREGTALQIGAGVSMIPANAFKITKFEKRFLLLIGVASGFSAVFGTPLTATFFAIEFFKVKGSMKYWLWIPILLFAELSNAISLSLGVRHIATPQLSIDWLTVFNQLHYYLLVFVGFLFASLLIVKTFRTSNFVFKKLHNEYLRVLFGGVSILILYLIWGLENYRCLGIHSIIDSFNTLQPTSSSSIKLGLTALAIGAGFRGGEVTPLFFIGAMLGNLFSVYVPIDMPILVALGLLFVFGRSTQTPIAASFLAYELFGLNTMFLIFPFIYISSQILKKDSIYK